MKTADEMRTIATRVREEEQTHIRNQALAILENKIAPLIESTSNNGECCLTYLVHNDACQRIIADELKKHEYEIDILGDAISIFW